MRKFVFVSCERRSAVIRDTVARQKLVTQVPRYDQWVQWLVSKQTIMGLLQLHSWEWYEVPKHGLLAMIQDNWQRSMIWAFEESDTAPRRSIPALAPRLSSHKFVVLFLWVTANRLMVGIDYLCCEGFATRRRYWQGREGMQVEFEYEYTQAWWLLELYVCCLIVF